MPSRALVIWESEQQVELDWLEGVRARRAPWGARQPLNDAYIVLLASHFQHFCRDLHTEAAEAVASSSAPQVTHLVRKALILGRQLDRGNATPSSLQADFGRLDVDLWPDLAERDSRTAARRRRLEQLNVWRNAVAHRDFRLSAAAQTVVARTRRSLAFARSCRSCCGVLARQMDSVVRARLGIVLGAPPW